MILDHNLENSFAEFKLLVSKIDIPGDAVTFYSKDEIQRLKSLLHDNIKLSKSILTELETHEKELIHGRETPTHEVPASPTSSVANSQHGEHKEIIKSKRGKKRPSQSTHQSDARKQQKIDDTAELNQSLLSDCTVIWRTLKAHPHSWIFLEPVDAVKLKLYDYHQIIKKPMDLGTIKKKLQKKVYTSPLQFAGDVRLTFANALKYNLKGQDAYIMAEVMSALFEEEWKSLSSKLDQLDQLSLIGDLRKDHDEIIYQNDILSPTRPSAVVRNINQLKKTAIRYTNKPGSINDKSLLRKTVDQLNRRLDKESRNPADSGSNKPCIRDETVTGGQELKRITSKVRNPADSSSNKPCVRDETATEGQELQRTTSKVRNPVDSGLNRACVKDKTATEEQQLRKITFKIRNPADSGLNKSCVRDETATEGQQLQKITSRSRNPADSGSNKSCVRDETATEGQELRKITSKIRNPADSDSNKSCVRYKTATEGQELGKITSKIRNPADSGSNKSCLRDETVTEGQELRKITSKIPGDFEDKDDEDEDIDVGDEMHFTSFPPVVIDRDGSPSGSSSSSSSSGSSCSGSSYSGSSDIANDSDKQVESDAESVAQTSASKEPSSDEKRANLPSNVDNAKRPIDEKTCLDGVKVTTKGEMIEQKKDVSPHRLLRTALLRSRFANTIIKAQGELSQPKQNTSVPGKLQEDKADLQRKKLQAEAKRAEAIVGENERLHREAARQAARQALEQMESAVEPPVSYNYMEGLDSRGSFFESGISLEKLSHSIAKEFGTSGLWQEKQS